MKKNGFTLVEMMVTIAILAIVATIGAVSLSGRNEKSAIAEGQTAIPTVISNILARAYEDGKTYSVTINSAGKVISIREIGLTPGAIVFAQEFKMPKGLMYSTTNSSFTIDEKGTLSNGFELAAKNIRGTKTLFTVIGRNITAPGIIIGIIELKNENNKKISY